MSERYYRSTTIRVDLAAIEHNFKEISHVNRDKTVIAVVKANAYGLGSSEIASFMSEVGVEFFAVATLDEAIELRMNGIKEKILVLGIIDPSDINKAIQHRIAVTAPSLNWVEEAQRNVGDKYDKEVWIHIKINNGFNRLGTHDVNEVSKMIEIIKASEYFIYEGVYAHYSSADMDNDSSNIEYERFKNIIKSIELPQYVHTQNSAASQRRDDDVTNAVRVGLSLYGYYPSPVVLNDSKAELRPSLTLQTKVVDTQVLAPGDKVGYGLTYEALDHEKIAVLPIGYADGFIRKMSGYTVTINDLPCEVVGRVCMDLSMVKVPEHVAVGDDVVIISNDPGAINSLERYSEKMETIPYESLCLLSRRLPRIYLNEGNEHVVNEVLK